MNKSFYKKGAEAELTETVFQSEKAILKERIPKSYRSSELDLKIRKQRTRSEAKLFKTAALKVRVPKVFEVNENVCSILMEFVEGKVLKDVVEKEPKLCEKAGQQIKLVHSLGIIHGDLTTSNLIVTPKKQICFVDFGLGFFSKRTEDIATDLIVFKKTFNATHSSLKNGWEKVMAGYKPNKELLTKMAAIEKRARYH